MALVTGNIQRVNVLLFFLIYYNNVGCLEMLGVGGPEWVHRPHSLVLKVSGHTASGTYKCEVSVEKSFYTLSSSKNLTVVVPPLSAPIITGGRDYYTEGDLIELTCMSNMSQPAAKLTWTVNDKEVQESEVTNKRFIKHQDSGLETSLLDLKLRAERTEFPGGICKIKCKADIAGGVWATSQSQVLSVGDSPSNPNLQLDYRTNTAHSTGSHLSYFNILLTFTVRLGWF